MSKSRKGFSLLEKGKDQSGIHMFRKNQKIKEEFSIFRKSEESGSFLHV
jgi:hypothetical protein